MTKADGVLNPILNRWLNPAEAAPRLDCAGCAKPWKCCDFQPFVANFLIGAILEKNPGFALAGPHHFQPLGLLPDHEFRARHAQTPKDERGADLVCQFFSKDTRVCRIWEFRPGECSTYFCEGLTPSIQALSEKSFAIESTLAQKALIELGFDSQRVGEQVDLLNDAGGPYLKYSESELREIYRECWMWARNLAPDEVGR